MFGDTRDQISETEDEYENGIPTTWKASEDNVRKIGTNPWFQDMQQNYYKQLQYTIANAPEHKKLDVANQLSVDSTLSLLYGMTPTEAHENRNRLMYDIMGQQMDDKSWLQAFSDSFSSFDRNFVTSLKAYQLMFIKDPAKRVKLQQEIDDRNLKEATVYKDLSNRNWLSKFVVFPGANILNQVMITLASALVGGAVGTSIAGAPALGLTTALPATTGVALIDGQLRDVSAKGALGWVLAKAGVPGIASSAGPQAIGSTIGTIASTVATMYPMAAGQSYLEMKSYVDAKGNHMSDDIAVPFAMLAGFGETALEFLTQTPVTDRVMKGLLGRTMPNLHEASRYAWGMMFKYSGNVILDAAKSIHNESFEEGVQQFYDEFTYWVAKFASNQTNETRFDMDWKSDLWDILKDGVKTYVQSLGPMTLAAGGDAVLNLGTGANITRKMQAEADSMFADSKQGVAVDINSVFIGKHEMGGNRISDESDVNTDLNGSEKSDANTDLSSEDDEYIRIHHLDETGRTKSADEIKAGYLKQKREPITVVQDERTGAYIPLNDSDKDVVSDLQNAGVGAVKVRVVSAKDGTMESSEYTGETVNRLALQLGASIAKDDQNTIVLPDQESVDAVAQDLRENETVYEEDVDTKTGGPVTLYLLDEDGKSVKITLSAEQELQTIEPDQKYIDRIEAPHIASTMSLENYARKRERDTVMEKVKAGMGGGDPLRVTEMADTILTVSGLTHIPSSTLADNIRVATDETEEDEWNALMTAAKERGYSGDAAVEFAEKQAGKVNGWKENNGGGRYTIHLTKSATESTIVHEMGHIMRELLGNDKERLAEFESIYGKKGSTWVTDVVDNKDGTYSLGGLSFASYQAAYKKAVENEEKFANDFVRYMKEGVAPTEGLRDVFSRMKTILKGLLGIYAQDLDPAVRKAFEDLYAQNDREKAGGAGTGTLMESVEESDNPAFFRENQETLAGFDGQIQKHDTGKKYKANEFYTAYAHTPLVYRELGYGDLPFVLFKSKVNQILAMPGEHVGTGTPHGDSVGIGTIREAVHGLSDPVAVFDSVDKDGNKRAGQFVVLVDVLDSKGKEVVVPLHMNMTAAHIAVDQIASVYGRPKNQIQNWTSKGLLRYVDKRKASRSESMQVQFLGERQSLASNSNIITRDQIVKKYGTKGTLFEPAASQAEYGETEERLRADPKNFDGEGRHLAPNGKPSRLTYRQWVTARTPAFKAWFGDWEHDPENASKVVDENGEPKVVYHNTTENFSVFREGKNGGLSGNGIYFSEYPLWQFGPVQIQAFLDIRHPITSETELDGMHEINSSGLPTRFIPDVLDRFPQFDGVMNHDEMTVRSSNQVKSATDNNGDFAIENENILFQTASDYVVRRASDIMDMALDPGIDAKTLRKKLGLNKNNKYSVNDIQRALAEFYKRATENRVDFTDLKDPDNIRNFARIYANEIEARLRRMPGETPIGWYSKNVEDALKIYSLVYPELADDNYKYPFLASLAITSQGETVEHNSDVAGRMYEYYKEHGVFPTSKKEIGTTKWGTMAANFEKLNLILSMLDNPGELKIELLKVYSVRNIEKMTGYSVSGESKDEELPLSAIFGPKIGGAFMANLFGDYTRFTMDKWMSRSLYRFTGKNINNDEMSSFLDHAEKLRDELRSTGNDIHYAYTVEGKKFAEIKLDEEYTLDDLMEDDELLKKYADALTKDIYSKTQTVDGETGSYNARLRVPVTTVAKTLSQNKMASESFNSEERQFFRAVSHEIQDILDAENPHDGKHFVEIADIQAIMWYNEKNLYDKIQSQQKTSIGTSYSEAARKFAQKKGVLNEGEINRDTLGSSSGIRPAGQGRDLPVLERDDQPTSLGQVQGDHGAEPEGWRSSTPSVYEWFKSNPKGVRRYLADSRLDHDGQEPARGSYVREHLEGEKRDVWELGLGENPSDKQKKAFGALDRYIKRFRLCFGKNKYTAKAIYSPSRQFMANLVFAQNKTDVALNLNDMYEIEASNSGLFIDRITAAVQAMKDSGTHPEWMRVDIHDDAYYKGSRLFLNKKGTVGFALHGDDIVSVFSDPSEKKSIYSIIPLAVSEGGRRLDCYAGQLPAMYSKFGFYPVGKYAWNDAYWDPARWDKSVMGTPDVVYMVYGLPSADAIDYLSYYSSPNAEDAPYFGADDDPEEAQSKALGRNGGIMFEGYDWDRRMSRNAVSAYEKGLAPLHKWTKAAISSVISAGASQEIADVLTKGLPTTALHDLFLRYSEWHHTGMRFSQTDFYRFNNSQLDGIETVADARKIVDAYKAYAELEKIRAGLEGKRITATYTDASGRKVTEGGVYSHYRFTPDSAVSEAERKVAEKIADMPGWLKEFLGRFKSYGAVGNDSSLSGKIYEPGRKPNRSQYDDPGYFRVGETRISGGFRPFSLQEWDGKAWVTKEEYDGRTNEVLDAWFHIPGSNVEWVDDFTSDSIPQELVEAEKPYVDAMNANMMDDDGGGKAKSDMMRYAFPIDSQRVVKADSDGITSEDRSENGDVLLVGGNNADGKSYLNDYKAALVPSYMPDNDKEILRSHGLDVVPYGIGERDSALIKYLDGNGTNETSGEQSGSNGLMFEPTQEENEQYTKEWYADVQKAVEEHYLVPDEVLEKFKGEDWADREMRFRATLVLPENQWWFEEAMAADDFDAYVDALNKKQTDEGKEPFDINLQEHSGEDYDWAKRIWDYAHLKSPVQKDREFVKNMTADRSTMISYAKTLRGYLVPQAGKRKKNGTVIYGQRYVYNSWPGVSTKVSHLSYKSTEEEVEAAKELVRANPHPYRRAFDYSVRQTQEAKETAAGGAYSSYGQEEYLENVGDNALDAWRAVERDAAKRELQKLREEKRNVKLGDLGVTDKTVKTVTEEEKKNPDIKDATAAKDATQEQATVKEATLTDKRLAKAKRKIKELKQTLADTEQELSATSDEYDDLLKSLGIADKESSDKIDFLKAYGKEKARQAKDLEEKLADRRNRVSELRSQLTDANEELRKTTSHSETLQNRLDTIKAKQVVAGLRSILKRVSSQSDSVDANVYDAFFLIHDRLLKDKGTGLVDIETDELHYDYESAINQISYYVASTEGASPNIVNHLVDGDSLSAWTPQELADLASVLSDMRKDAQVSLARKKMERMQRLHDEAYVLYREITGQNGSLTYDDQMDVWLLNNDVVDNIKKKKDNALEGFSLAFSKMQRVARVVDGNREGVVYDRFVRKAWESNMQELRGVSKRLDAADKEMKRLKITDDWLAQEIYTYKSGATDVTLTRGQVIGLYVYSKNEVERAKLVAKQGNNISSADLASALALLSDNDKAWGDYMINDFAQNRERVADTYYQVYNRLLGWRENYFTMIGDGKIGDGEQDILDGPQQQKKRYVNKSMTKEIAERALYPLKLDVTQSWISQVRKEEHFVAFADWSRDSQHLLQGSGAMGTIIQTKYGKHMLDTFQHYTNDVGSPNTMMTNMEQTLNRVISRGAVAMLSYNLLTTIKQLPAVMAAFGQVGVGEFYKAGVELITDRKRTLDMIYEKAPDIRDRYISQDVQRAVETKAANKVDKVIKGVGEVGLQPVQFFDQAVATQLWYAAYLTNLNKGLSEQEAVFKASQLISETQNTNQVTDLSEIQRTRNPFTRSAIMFTNQLMQYYNMWRYDIGFYRANGQKGKMWGTVANILLNAGVMALVSGALLKRPSDDDDKDKWRRFATQYIGVLLGQALPLVGSMIQEGMEGFSGSFISLFSSVGQMIKVAMSEDKGGGEKKERMKSSMKDLIVDGLAFAGAPATAGKRVILAISDSDWYYLFGTDWGKYGPGTFGNQE